QAQEPHLRANLEPEGVRQFSWPESVLCNHKAELIRPDSKGVFLHQVPAGRPELHPALCRFITCALIRETGLKASDDLRARQPYADQGRYQERKIMLRTFWKQPEGNRPGDDEGQHPATREAEENAMGHERGSEECQALEPPLLCLQAEEKGEAQAGYEGDGV